MKGSKNRRAMEAASPLEHETIPALVERPMRLDPSGVALKCREGAEYRAVTYGELERRAAAFGTSLIVMGVEPGGRVALMAGNSPEWAIAYLGAVSCGAAIVPIDTQLGENEVRRLLLHSRASAFFASRSILDGFTGGISIPGVETIEIGGRGGAAHRSFEDVLVEGERLLAGGDRRFSERRTAVRPEDTAAICYTSGTTGQPKGAVLLHRNISTNVAACTRRIPVRREDTFLSILPLYHTLATTANLLVPLSIGAAVFFGRSLKSRDLREDIERERVTVMIGVPLIFERMAKAFDKRVAELPAHRRFLFEAACAAILPTGRLFATDLAQPLFRRQREAAGIGSIRFCVSGAAALKNETERTLSRIGIPVLQGYGMTEASPVISVNPLERPRRGTVGPPLAFVDARIDDPGADGVGEIVVRGPNLMAGYLDDPASTEAVLKNGWLYTGDLGRIGPDGYIAFAGRKKSTIVTAGGKNVYPDEIEMRLERSPYILECVVLPAPDRKGNERVGAIVVPDYEAIASAGPAPRRTTDEEVKHIISDEVRSACAELPEYKRVREIRIRAEEFPKTSTRKIKRHLVKWPEE